MTKAAKKRKPSNLAYGFRGLASMMVNEQIIESSHLDPQSQGREKFTENRASAHLLQQCHISQAFPNSFNNWGSSIQIHELIGGEAFLLEPHRCGIAYKRRDSKLL